MRSSRGSIILAVILLTFMVLISAFVRLQVLNRSQYEQKSLNNSIRAVQINPVRGLIRDRNGRILVDNRPSFALAVVPKTIADSTLKYVVTRLALDSAKVQAMLKRDYGLRPVIIARDVPLQVVIDLEERRLDFPGVLTVAETKRFYPPDVRSPHIFGSIGEVTRVEQLFNPQYKSGDLVGKSGLEKKYDLDLRGSKGIRYIRVDATGRELGDYNSSRNIPPVHGNDLYLYEDYDLQSFAESLFQDKRGALVAIDVRNGGIVALVSKPDYDPRDLSGRINSILWKKLLDDPGHPLFSRAIQSTYPPGSTYKLVAALAALQEKIITPRWRAFCPGYFKLGRRTIHCWNKSGHGNIDLLQAIKGSCNVYFYQLGLKIGLNVWSRYSTLLGFGRPTGIDLPDEKGGLVPSEAYYNRIFGKNGWTRGNLANLAIGQGELLVTPVQMAQFAMIMANKGVYHPPHLVDHIYNYSAKKMVKFPVRTRYIEGISNDVYDVVREGMHQVVNGGTGWRAKVRNIDMAGKTGTAQNPHGEDHAWFIGFAPYDLPEVAIAVIVENGGSGGGIAAPIARRFLEMYFYGEELPLPVIRKDSTQTPDLDIPLPVLEDLQPMPISVPADSN